MRPQNICEIELHTLVYENALFKEKIMCMHTGTKYAKFALYSLAFTYIYFIFL